MGQTQAKKTLQPAKNKRGIKSYIIRSRTSKAQKFALENYANEFEIKLKQGTNKADTSDFFAQKKQKIALEVGFGMGENLIYNAQNHLHINWIGVETHEAGVGRLFNLAHKAKLNNLKIYRGDICIFLQSLKNDSLDWVQIFFPDPWQKKRHHKRRLIQLAFLQQLSQKMKQSGTLEIATDWQNYAEYLLEIFNLCEVKKMFSASENNGKRSENRVLTNFEKKAHKAQRKVFDFSFIAQK